VTRCLAARDRNSQSELPAAGRAISGTALRTLSPKETPRLDFKKFETD